MIAPPANHTRRMRRSYRLRVWLAGAWPFLLIAAVILAAGVISR